MFRFKRVLSSKLQENGIEYHILHYDVILNFLGVASFPLVIVSILNKFGIFMTYCSTIVSTFVINKS